MKNIYDINIDPTTGTLSFVLNLTSKLDENEFIVFVDECYNFANMYSDQSEKHTYYFNKSNSVININLLQDYTYFIEITHKSINDMSDHMKYIKALSGADNYVSEGVYYKSEILYEAEINHIKRTCNMCLNDKNMKDLVYVVFKRQLLDSALETDDCAMCMQLYLELSKLLRMDIYDCCCESNSNCKNGCCTLK